MLVDGETFKAAMRKDGRTIEQLADAASVSTDTVRRCRKGENVMPRSLGFVSYALGKDPKEFAVNEGYNEGYKSKNALDSFEVELAMARAMLTVEDIRYEMGVKRGLVQGIIRGTACDPKHLPELSRILGVDAKTLIFDQEAAYFGRP